MNVQSILDSLLASGKELVTSAKDVAENGLGVSKDGDNRDQTMKTLGTGAAVGGLFAMMLGTKRGRKFGGKALALGSLAALAAVAYKSYSKLTSNDDESSKNKPVTQLTGDDAQARAIMLLRGMIAAANADGHVDARETETIQKEIAKLDIEDVVRNMLLKEISQPLRIDEVIEMADSRAAAVELYIISSVVIDETNLDERAYLETLATGLKIPDSVVVEIRTMVVS